MSRRRFGDADDTYKDFISAIDDHKRKRQHAAAAAAAAAAQQQQQQQAQPPPASASSINFQGSSAMGPPPLHPYSGLLHEEMSGPGGVGLGSPHLRAYELQTELPIGASEKEYLASRESAPLLRRPSSFSLGASAGHGGSARNLRVPLHIGGGGSTGGFEGDDAPFNNNDRKAEATSEHTWLTKRNLDLVVQKKSIWIFVNGMFGVALMCAILEVCWTPDWQLQRYDGDMSVPAGYYADLEWVANRLSQSPSSLPKSWSWNALGAECPSPVRSATMEVLKLVLTFSTLLLCWQILDRKRLQVSIKFHEQRRKLKAKGFNQERDKLFMSSLSNASNISTLGLLSLSRSQFRWDLWVSLLACLIQPVPFTHQLTRGYVDDKIGMLMWGRIFLGFRVIRDCSEIWLSRRSIKHQSSFQIKTPDFDWWLSCKTISYRSPLFFAGCFYFLCIIIFGHSLYLSERELLPAYFTLSTSIFCSFQIVSIGWPADVWEIYMPITMLGKMVSMFAGMAGLILISFVIVTVGSALYPSKFEENALNFIAMDKVRQKERDGSAALIQYVWRNAQREAELEAKLRPKNPALYEEISEQEEKAFMERFIAKSKELRTIRRERAELEERSDPTSERNISPMDLFFDVKLEAIRTDIMHQNAKNNQQYMSLLATLNQIMHKAQQKEKHQLQQLLQQQQAAGGTAAAPSAGKKQRGEKKAALEAHLTPSASVPSFSAVAALAVAPPTAAADPGSNSPSPHAATPAAAQSQSREGRFGDAPSELSDEARTPGR